MRAACSIAGAVALWLLSGAPAGAGEEPAVPAAAPGAAEARAAWAWLEATQVYRGGLLEQARRLREADVDGRHAETVGQALRDALDASGPVVEAAEDEFRRAFDASDWDAYDPEAEAGLLETGLDMVARHALERDPARAVAVWDRLIAARPESAAARRARTTWLPIALPSVGDLEAAGVRLLQMAEAASAEDRPVLLQAVGDVLALSGDYAGAQETYARAWEGIPADAGRDDARGRLKPYLELRRLLVGKPAPAVAGGEWFGSEEISWTSLRGRVLLLDYWATW